MGNGFDTPRNARPVMEALEPRLLLDGSVIISEFMAINDTGLETRVRDSAGDPFTGDPITPDWIEIHNPTTSQIDLSGWKLEDGGNEWAFPADTSISPHGYLVVFASDEDITDPALDEFGYLHTNFKLSGSGEYLGLLDDTGAVVHEYDEYPAQTGDISYGIAQDIETTEFVSSGDTARYLVPDEDPDYWTTLGFDDGGWQTGDTGLGFSDLVSGLAVWNYKANTLVGNLGVALQVIDTPGMQSYVNSENIAVINYWNSDGHGHYLDEVNFPGFTGVMDDFVVEATGFVTIPSGGQWSFGVNSDDGFQLTITGTTTAAVTNSSTPAGSDTISYFGVRGNQDTFGVFEFAGSGTYELRLVFYERGGGSSVEMFAAPGYHLSWSSGDFDLVGDTAAGGLEVAGEPVTGGGGGGAFAALIETDVEGVMKGTNASMFVRLPFTVADPAQLESLTLKMKYDDGYVAYLNGQEIAQQNAPPSPVWNSSATGERTDPQATTWENVDASAHLDKLVAGDNVLAVHAMNYATDDGDFLILPELVQVKYLGLGEHFFATATPGDVNSEEYWMYVEDTKFDHDRGFYETAFELEITSDTDGATIVYTTDGSEPTLSNGTQVAAPDPGTPPVATVTISTTTAVRAAAFKDFYEPTNVDTQTYIFLDDVIGQPSNPAGFPGLWRTEPADYEMDPQIINDPLYSETLIDDLLSLPTMSIVMNVDDLFGYNTGIYSNPNAQGVQWERSASLEYFDPNSSDEFQVNAGVRIYGGVGRNPGYKKHSFRVLFKSDYGPTKLQFPLFEGAVDEFDTIILRSNFNDAWVWGGAPTQFVRDEFAGQLQNAMGDPGRHGNFVHLYVNGLYWGLYNPCERPDTSFSASYFGGDAEDWDGLNSGNVVNTAGLTQAEINLRKEAWNTLMEMAPNLGDNEWYQRVQGNNPDGTNNPAYEDYLDIDNYINFLLMNQWAGNNDWGSHNWYAGRLRGPESTGFKSYSWDAEWIVHMRSGLYDNTVNDATTSNWLLKPYTYLRNNAEFRMRYADHIHEHMFNGGALTPEFTGALYQALVDEIEQSVKAETARWGDVVREPPYDLEDWTNERDYLLNEYLPQRTDILIQQLKNANLYPDVVAPSFNINGSYQHGGTIDLGDTLTIDAPAGTIYYTTDGTDPIDSGTIYSDAVTLDQGTHVKSRVYDNGEWSALNQATFYIDLAPDIRITEIMYNPADPTQDEIDQGYTNNNDFEFIEIKNISATETLPLAGLRFSDGIDFTFGEISVAPGEYVVVVSNQAAFLFRYSSFTGEIAGEYGTGIVGGTQLSNGGEKIELDAPVGGIIHEFRYKDGWYDHTDGDGFSLTIRDPDGALELWGRKEGWRPSAAPGGTPGYDDTLVDPGSIIINEVLAHSNTPFVDVIELHNTSDSDINVSGWFLSDRKTDELGNELLTKYQIPSLPAIGAGQYLVLYEDTHFGTAFSLSELGDDVYLSSNAGGVAGGYREHVDFGASPNNVSIGLHTKSTGGTDFTLLSAHSFGWGNADPYFEDLVINEVMYHPTDPTPDELVAGFINDDDFEFIEIYNRSGGTVDLRDFYVGNGIGFTFGWYNADSAGNESWTLEPGATATWSATFAAGEYEVFARWDLLDGEGNERSLDGQARYVIAHSGGSTEVIRDQKPEDDDEGPGYMDEYGWVSLGTYEFNGSGQVVLTRGTNNPGNWTIADQVKFVNPTDEVVVDDLTLDSWFTSNGTTTIAPGGYAVMVSDYDAFDERYDIAGNGITVAGEYTGNLSNNGEKIKLMCAGGAEPSGFIPYYRVDYVNYDDELPWPTEPDGAGSSLSRKRGSPDELYGNDPASWEAGSYLGTPGEANEFIDRDAPGQPTDLSATVALDENDDTKSRIELTWTEADEPESYVDHYVIYRDGQPIGTPDGTTFTFADTEVAPVTPYSYQVSAVNRDWYEGELSAAADITIPGVESFELPGSTTIRLFFTEALVQGSAELLDNYTFVGGTLLGASLEPDEITVTLTTTEFQIGQQCTVTAGSIDTVSGLLMPAGQQVNFEYCPIGAGAILREYWTGISGDAVSDLTGNPDYPDTPDGHSYPLLFEGPVDWADNYGTRIRGYVHPAESGNYTFWIASDDNSELWLSTDADPANATLIAFVGTWTGSREWNRFDSQESAEIPLWVGRKYYIEARQKEGNGEDHIAVAWQMTGGTFEGPIPGVHLTPFGEIPDLSPPSMPLNLSAQTVGETRVDLSWDASYDPDSGVDHYTIYRDGQAYDTSATPGYSDTGASAGTRHWYQISAVNPDDFESGPSVALSVAPPGIASVDATSPTTVRLMFTEPLEQSSAEQTANYAIPGVTVQSAVLQSDGFTVTLTSSAMTAGTPYTVTVNGLSTISGNPLPADMQETFQVGGTILWEYWLGISGTPVSNLTSDPDYPDNPDGQEYRTLFEAPTNWANYYGGRISGYLYPYVTGNHTFWIASDDNGELWLSTDENPANKALIARVPQWSSSRQWNRYAVQKSGEIYLVAGQRYYIEALMKEHSGGDNLAVAWKPPGTIFNGVPIPGEYLSPYAGFFEPLPVNVTVDPLSTTDSTPALSGTVDDSAVAITVYVDGHYYAAANNGDDTWRLSDNAIGPALTPGTYEVTACAADTDGRTAFDTTTDELVVNQPPAEIVARYIFYNNSAFDGNDGAADARDDDAVAPDKSALIPGQTATFANYTSYTRGINGIMVDIDALRSMSLTDQDFIFKVGNDNGPGGWSPAPDPSITVREGEGAGGSDRVTIIWDDNDIQKQWLQVTVKATDDTGLAEADVFYFGNAIGEAGNSSGNAIVNAIDEILARSNPHWFLDPAKIDDAYDYNRDKRVDAADQVTARNNHTFFLTDLNLITVPLGGGEGSGLMVEGGDGTPATMTASPNVPQVGAASELAPVTPGCIHPGRNAHEYMAQQPFERTSAAASVLRGDAAQDEFASKPAIALSPAAYPPIVPVVDEPIASAASAASAPASLEPGLDTGLVDILAEMVAIPGVV